MDAKRAGAAAFVSRQSLRPAELLRRLRDPAPPVSGLLLDLCGVLYDDSTWPRWLFKLVQRLGLHTTYAPFFRVWRREYLERVKRRELEYWQALRLFLRSVGLTNGQIDEVEAASHARLREYESEIMPMPGVVNVLTQLQSRGIQLALLSSGCLDMRGVQKQVHVLGLESYFDSVLSVPDLWQEHPDRPAIEVAVEATGLPVARLGFVGRDAAMLTAAGECGVRRIAVNYDEDALADVYIRSFDQLLNALPWDTERAEVP